MRYRKGSIALSRTQDYPLLHEVLQSGFITHNQLFESLRLDYCTTSRNAFNNRALRLVKHGLLTRSAVAFPNHDAIYSISQTGALALAAEQSYFFESARDFRAGRSNSSLQHHLDLNEIRLALKRTGSLICWMSELEVRSRNDLTSCGYWKYYDAIVTVRVAGQDSRFALEYERTPKATRHYAAIRERLDQETSIAHFLYLVPSRDLMWFIAQKLSQCKRELYIGLFRDFLEQTLMLQVRRNGSPATSPLGSLLAKGKEPQHPGTLFADIAV